MKKTVWIVTSVAVAVFTLACSDNNAAKMAQQIGADNAATAQGNLTVTGCLARADEMPGSVGTAGNGSPAATNPSTSGTGASTPSSATERFVLRQAQPAGSNSAASAVGTSGSGVSYTLSGDAVEIGSHAGQQVEVLGRLDSIASDGGGQRLTVTSIRTVADTCSNP
jgi:hypothetical protein